MNEREQREREGGLSTADIAGDRTQTGQGTEARTRDQGDGGRQDKSRERESAGSLESKQMAPLMPESEIASKRERWQSIQAKFVDEPQASVREADGLVAEVIQTLARSFAGQREQMESQWSRGSEVSTEDLRQALQQYRSFFERLLAA